MIVTTDAKQSPAALSEHAVRSAWTSLALAEARNLTLHPAVLAALLLALAPWVTQLATNPTADDFADLTSTSWTVQYPMLILAAGVFVGSNLIALRAHRCRTEEFERVLSLPQWHRTGALYVASLLPAGLALLLCVVRLSVLAAQPGAVGTVQVGELLTVPAVVLLAGVLGTSVGTVVRNTAAGFVTLAAMVVVGVVGVVAVSVRVRWLGFVAGENPFVSPPMPSTLVDRPEWWHLAWLASLTVIAGAVSLHRSGLGVKPVAAVVAVAATAAVGSGVMQVRPASPELRHQTMVANTAPSGMQVCEVRRQVTYCAFVEFRNWIDVWAAVVNGQLNLTGVKTSDRRLAVRQHLPLTTDSKGYPVALPLSQWSEDDAKAGIPNALPVSTHWAAGGVDSYQEEQVIGFSSLVSAVVVTNEQLQTDGFTLCGGQGAVSLWLAAAATEDTRRALKTVLLHTSGGGGLSLPVLNADTSVEWGPREVELAQTMLDADQVTVRANLIQHWETLVNPATGIDQAAQTLGLNAPTRVSSAEGGLCQ